MALLPPGKHPKRIAAIANDPATPEVPYGATHTVEIQLVDVYQLCSMILSPRVAKVPATSMGVGSLHESMLRSRPRKPRVLECQSVRDSKIESSEGLLHLRRVESESVC